MAKKYLLIILILLLAFALRTHRLTTIPPGLTHDEANHGRDSINILDGVLLFYFPLNYGSEPLYNYVVAGSMALVGENLFALRLVNVMFGTLAVAAAYLWARWVFGRWTALVTAALLAVSFWPVATSRQALRAGLLPFIATGAVIFFWLILRWGKRVMAGEETGYSHVIWPILGFASCVTITLHTYLAARVLWLIFPIFIVYLGLTQIPLFKAIWRPVLAGLILAGLMVIPMFAYVEAHPEAETRLQMLEGPLQSLTSGELKPLLSNAGKALLGFVWPGYGDGFMAYNLPGRPVLEIATVVFFLVGLAASFWRWRQPAYAFLLIWFLVGIAPSLITGPEANTTRNLGALAPTYMLPAIGFVTIARQTFKEWGRPARIASALVLVIWLFFVGTATIRDYFVRWAQSADVRAAYQSTLGEAMDYVAGISDGGPVVVSSVYPGPAHDPSIARVLLPDGNFDLRWVDARYALLFPDGSSSQLILPSSTPLHPAFAGLVQELNTVVLRPDDLDPSFTINSLQAKEWQSSKTRPNFGNALSLLEARWLLETYQPGETAELLTIWQVVDPAQVGPIVPPFFETDVAIFTHVLDSEGNIIAQRDSLEAPSWDWQAGDILMQVHPVLVPAESLPGEFQTLVGIFDRASGERLPLMGPSGEIVGNGTFVVPLNVDE